jgi:hypothetical protein
MHMGQIRLHPTTSSQFSLSPPCSDCQGDPRHGILLTVVWYSIFQGRSPLLPSVCCPSHPIDLIHPLEWLQGLDRSTSLTGRGHLPLTYRSTFTAAPHDSDKVACRHQILDPDAGEVSRKCKHESLLYSPTRGPETSKRLRTRSNIVGIV